MLCITHNQIPRECDSPSTVVIMLYKIYIMLLPTDKWTLVLAGVPELLLSIIFLCISLAMCLSKSENQLYLALYSVCIPFFSIYIVCIEYNNLLLDFLLISNSMLDIIYIDYCL